MDTIILFDHLGPYHLARLRAASAAVELLAVEVAGKSGEYAWTRSEERGVEYEGLRHVTLQAGARSEEMGLKQLKHRLTEALSSFSPSAVLVPGWSSTAAFAAMDWCGRNSVPIVTMSESTAWDENRSTWREAVKRRIVSMCSSALVGGHPHVDYMRKLGMPADRVFMGYDAVDNGYFAAGAAKARSEEQNARSRHGLPEKYFLASARFIEKKNLPRLLQAYAEYRAKCQVPSAKCEPWDLVLLGDGELRPALASLCSALGLDACVHMPGFKQYPELPIYYGLASAFVHASTTEQWGLVVNEAMASGLPVLVSNRCGCASDLVQDGFNGFTFDPYNVEELAQLMLRVASMEQGARSKMGDASRRIISDWGPERFAAGLKQAVECALKVGPKKASLLDRLLLRALISR